jgi:ribosomal protein S18 acetylase RimI-like enzyme
MYILVNATENNIELIKDIKLEMIFSSPDEFREEDIDKIKEYVDITVKEFLKDYKLVIINDSIAGIFFVRDFEDGVLIDEIYLYDEYRNKGIGTELINSVYNPNIYLWVYKNNKGAISLYEKLGFTNVEETDTRYKMKKTK